MEIGPSSGNLPLRMYSDVAGEDPVLLRARVTEELGRPAAAVIDFAGPRTQISPDKLLGKQIGIEMTLPRGTRRWTLHVTALEYHGRQGGNTLYTAELHSKMWFLTRRTNLRIFQGKTTPDIIQEIMQDYGFSGDLQFNLSETYAARDVCVQYRESDFDFLSRLMEQEGIHYASTYDGDTERVRMADSNGVYDALAPFAQLVYQDKNAGVSPEFGHVYALHQRDRVTGGKVTLNDFCFTSPRADLQALSAIPRGKHAFKSLESYDHPGRYREAGPGGPRARVRMETLSAGHQRLVGAANIGFLTPGGEFTVQGHPAVPEARKYILTSLTHQVRLNETNVPDPSLLEGWGTRLDFGNENADDLRVDFEALEQAHPFRTEAATAWPRVAGVQTATVVGPAGEEIHTDSYGRVKVQFHWDREGREDENSFVWLRVMMPWTGKNWGMIHIPRIGQEVVVDFEEGDPDRPLVIGMVYNADTMPPYALPDNMTQTGIKTNSSKNGGGFNELVFEDKKGAEFVRFQSERDYRQIVKNDAEITVGLEHKDKGDMSLQVHRNLTETVKTGDHTFTVAAGNQTVAVKKDRTETIEGNQTLTVTKDVTETVKQGNVTRTVDTGNVTDTIKTGSVSQTIKMGSYNQAIDMGNSETVLKMGNLSVDAKLGKIDMTAMQSITLKVGTNSIKIDQTGVTISALMVKINATGMLEAKAPMTTVKGDAMLILKGGLTMIN